MSAERRRHLFEQWYSTYGTHAKKGLYFQALKDPYYVLDKRATNPGRPGFVQTVDRTLFPPRGSSLYELTDCKKLKALFDGTAQDVVADDGSMRAGIGCYALWLRLADPEEWENESFWDGDCASDGSPTGRTRMATLLTNGFDYLKALENRKRTYKMDKYLAAIRTKPFILLAGISGTGKSRIVRQLARGCCPEKKDGQPHPLIDEQKPGNYELIPVRPNWHDSTELMGYVTRITGTNTPKYVLTPFVKFLVKAWLHKDVPFFLCLDEMNLAPVEQYFAEYLSKIETRKLSGGDIVTDVLVEFPDEILDSVLSEISRELPLVSTTKQVSGDAKPEARKRDKDSLYKQWDDFLAEWPISRLREIKLEEYTKAGSADTFTYAIEVKLSNLGSIWGGSAFKFGIYSRDPNGKLTEYKPGSKQIGTSDYAWYRKYGQTKDAAWSVVKESIVAIAEAAHDAGVQLRQVAELQQAPDHPILWGFPESHYLDFFIFQVA